MNNTYLNSSVGTIINISGNNAVSFISSINSSNVIGVTANISSNVINIICSVPGPFEVSEVDAVDTPLLSAGIVPGKYGNTSGITIISGTVMNPTFNANSFFSIGTNWNSILNSMPKSLRRAWKNIFISQPEREKIGTNSYRELNFYTGSKSPILGRPWESGVPIPNYAINEIPNGIINGNNKVFTLEHNFIQDSLWIIENGKTIVSNIGYTSSGNTITFTSAPVENSFLFAFYTY